MFDNIGDKIKALSRVLCWIGIIFFVIDGFVIMAKDDDLVFTGLLTIVIGSLLSWVGSFVLYGFGQLVENSDKLVAQNVSHNNINTTPSIFPNCITENNPAKDAEQQLKYFIEKTLDNQSMSKPVLDIFWKYKKYMYGCYPKNETISALQEIIDYCQKNEIENVSESMIIFAKTKIDFINN